MKQKLNLWLLAALLCGMSMSVTSCKDDDKDSNGSGTDSGTDTEVMDANDTPERQMAWRWLWSLTDAEVLTDNWDQQQYEATFGEASKNYANTRVIFVRDMDDARTVFSSVTGCDPDELKSARTFSAGDYGQMAWSPSPQGEKHIATVQVSSRLMPRLERIIFCTPDQADDNASIKGTCYYRLGDVIEDKEGYYWVCIRPSFSQNKADESYWVNIFNANPETGKGEQTGKTPGVPKDNIFSKYNHKYNGNGILLPTALKSERKHMYLLSNLIQALLSPEDYKEKVGTQGKGLCGFDYQYHGVNYLTRVNQYWIKHGIWEKLFNSTYSKLKEVSNLYFFYNGYHWSVGSTAGFWIYTSSSHGYQSKYTGSMDDDDTLFEMKEEGSGFDIHKFAHDPNYDKTTDGLPRGANWAPRVQSSGGSSYFVVRYRSGSQIDKTYNPMKNMTGVWDTYRYNYETKTLAGSDVETEQSIGLYNDKTTVTDPYTGFSHYHVGDVYRDQYNRKWFVVSMSGDAGFDKKPSGQVDYKDNESSPWTELITFDGMKSDLDNPGTLRNAPSLNDAIRGSMFLWWLYSNSAITLEKGRESHFSSTSEKLDFRPAANIYEHTGVDIRYLFQSIEAQSGDSRQATEVFSVMYNDGSGNALNQRLLRIVCNHQNDRQDPEFYIWSRYPKNPSSTAIKLPADAFGNIDIVLQDLLSEDMVKKYAEDSYARQPLRAVFSLPQGVKGVPREPRKETDSRAAKVENYFYNKEVMQSFKFPADMWNSPIVCFSMTRVRDRGDDDYAETTEDGLRLTPVGLVKYSEAEVGQVRYDQHLTYTMFDLVKVDGIRYSPYWKSVVDK